MIMRINLKKLSALITLAVSLSLVWPVVSRADTTNKFVAALKGELNSSINGKVAHTTTDITYVYRRIHSGNQVGFILDGIKLINATPNGNQKVVVTRDRFYSGERDKYIDISRDKADPALKEELEATYGTPLSRAILDETGAETNVTILARPGAKKVLQGGLLNGIRQFHPPYSYSATREWTTDEEIPMGNGGTVRGALTFKKMKPSDTGSGQPRLSVVTVSGQLTNAEFHPTNGPTHKNIIFQVSGTQTYDTTLQEWTAANLTMAITLDLYDGDKKTGTTTGTIHSTLEKVPLSYDLQPK